MLFQLGIVLIILSIYLTRLSIKKDTDSYFGYALVLFISAIVVIVVYNPLSYYIEYNKVNQKVILYEQQNKDIDNEIRDIVTSTYEKETELYKDIKNKKATSLILMFPKVKSIDLVNKQISIYMKNKEKINKLKEKRIDFETSKILSTLV